MGISAEQARAIRERQMSHDLYRSGIDHYSGEYDETAMNHWVNQMAGQPTTSPWINVTDDSRRSTYNAFMEDNYNPFIGNEGAWVTPEGNDLRGSNNGTAEGYRDDSIAGWFKDAFAGQDRVNDRADALRTLGGWNNQVRNPDYQSNMDPSEQWMDGAGRGINKATTRMNQRYFDEMDLANKYGLTFEDPRQAKYDAMVAGFSSPSESTGGFMDAYNSARPPAASAAGMAGVAGPRPAAPEVKPGGFMESYLKRKAETKPSVMSLMTELKDA